LKILLSAYACEPNKGSEPGVGWNWALELAKQNHRVCVLTRLSNRPSIESALASSGEVPGLRFVYFDLPGWARWWKKGLRGIYLYYFLWQIGAFLAARELHKQDRFDLVHHVTFVSIRQPSFMGLLGIPFIFGPVGGGENTPWALRRSFPFRGWLWELARDIQCM
jgi:hypothetical protein